MTNGSGLDIVSLWRSAVAAVDEEAYEADPQLASIRPGMPKCALALLVFLAADAAGTRVDDGTLIRAATSVELLGMGIARHYAAPADSDDPPLDLIAGDFFCASAMQLAASLGRPWLNGLLAAVVAETALAEDELADRQMSAERAVGALRRRAELYAAACEIAVSVGAPEHHRDGRQERWRELGRHLGVLRIARSDEWAAARTVLPPDFLATCRVELDGLVDECEEGRRAESLRAYCASAGDWTPGAVT